MAEALLGIDLGGTLVKSALVSRDKRILSKDKRPTRAHEGLDTVIDVMVESAEAVLASAGHTREDVLAACVGAPGPGDPHTGVVFSPSNLPGWKDVPLAELMTERLGLPCFVDNDANLACYGEFWLGAGQGTQSMCLLTLGTGVGGGIIVFGRLLRGIDGTAAEIGHMIVQRDGRQCGCGARGCLEAYASVTGMVQTAVEGMESGRKTVLSDRCAGNPDMLTGEMISDVAAAGDEFAIWVIQETGAWLGVGIAGLINLFNPEKVVLAGGMINAGPVLLDAIRKRALHDAFDVPANRVEIVTTALQGDSGVLGAAGVALERLEEERSNPPNNQQP